MRWTRALAPCLTWLSPRLPPALCGPGQLVICRRGLREKRLHAERLTLLAVEITRQFCGRPREMHLALAAHAPRTATATCHDKNGTGRGHGRTSRATRDASCVRVLHPGRRCAPADRFRGRPRGRALVGARLSTAAPQPQTFLELTSHRQFERPARPSSSAGIRNPRATLVGWRLLSSSLTSASPA